MSFATKHTKELKFKGVWKHYDTRHFIWPPTLGRSIVLNDSKLERKDKKKEEEAGER